MTHILVHGTFDTDNRPEGDRWWQKGSAFHDELEAAGASIQQFVWSGDNSERARRKASVNLARTVRAAVKETDEVVTVIAHSHGGNIVRDALRMMPNAARLQVRAITVGTPFLHRQRFILHRYDLSGIMLTFLGFLLIAPGLLIALNGFGRVDLWAQVVGAASLLFGGVLVAYPTIRLVYVTVRRIKRAIGRVTMSFPPIRVVTHPGDEVLALFQTLIDIKLRPMDYMKTVASIQRIAKPFSAIVALGVSGLAVVWWVNTGLATRLAYSGGSGADAALTVTQIAAIAVGVGGAVVSIVYITLTVVGLLLAFPIKTFLNGVVDGAVKASVFGQDADAYVRSVRAHPADPFEFVDIGDAALADMSADTAAALGERVTEMKRFVEDAARLEGDAMTSLLEMFKWNELIHTYYFQHPDARRAIIEAATAK